MRDLFYSVPVTRSIFSTRALAELLESCYGLSQAECTLIKGKVCDTYAVKSPKNKYILRVYRHTQRTFEEISSEIAIIDFLHTSGLAVAPVVPQLDGKEILTISAPEGLRFAALFTFKEGHFLGRQPVISDVRNFGEVLAQCHLLLDKYSLKAVRPVVDFNFIVSKPVAAFEKLFPERTEIIDYLKHGVETLQQKFAALSSDPPEYGLIHGDLIPSNVLVSASGEIILLDFDFCGWGWRGFDIATYMTEIQYWKAPPESTATFLQGYEKLRPLSELEKTMLPVFAAARSYFGFGFPALNVNEWGSNYYSFSFIETQLELIQYYMAQIPL